jgi:hypothetical protein
MSVAKKILMGSGATDYEIDQSAMFDLGNTVYLHRTPGSAGNRDRWTFSCWIKRSEISVSAETALFGSYTDANNRDVLRFKSSDELEFQNVSGGTTYSKKSDAKYRDPGAWYHVVAVYDSANSTADYRIRLYINGSEITDSTGTDPASGTDSSINNNVAHYIGARSSDGNPSLYWVGYMAEVHFVDGSALTPSSFGKTDSDTGEWVPKQASVTYGTNGFYLKFVSGATGTDSSGEGNNFTTVDLDAYDIMPDTPTNNFATLNFLDTGPGNFHQGGLRLQTTNHNDTASTFKFPSTGKWYFEIYCITAGAFYQGICPIRYTGNVGNWDTSNLALRADNGAKYSYHSGGWQSDSYGSAFGNGDIIQCAVDMDNGKIWWGDSGTWIASGNPGAGSNEAFTFTASLGWKPFIYGPGSTYAIDVIFNFGQTGTFVGYVTAGGNTDGNGYGNFKYSVPSGFLALCSANIPDPTIKEGTDHFNSLLYTGNDTDDRALTGVGFQPDWVWIKCRSINANHGVSDSQRVESGTYKIIYPDANNAESTSGPYISAISSDGFSLANSGSDNQNNETYVAWNWLAGTSFSNDASATGIGSVDSSGVVNATAGFSIVKFTMPSSGQATVKHGLSAKPKAMITKDLDDTYNWAVFHEDTTDTTSKFLRLNTNDAIVTYSTVWGAALPTSSVFGVTAGGLAAASSEVIAYCFTPIEGYSAFGYYVGDNSTDGPMINVGFLPAFTMIKRTDSTGSWFMYDNKRDTFNAVDEGLFADVVTAEATQTNGMIDFLSNGFKIRSTGTAINASSGTYAYMAFAESPFKYANAR